ncbi:hypothetical protein D9M68_943190 [compost metagenome]
MTGEIGLVRADHRQIVGASDLEHFVRSPLAVLPAPDRAGKFTEIDLGIEIGRKITAMTARVHIDDVDGIDPVEIVLGGQSRIGIDDARIKAGAENGGDALALALVPVPPFIIAIPGRRFADL